MSLTHLFHTIRSYRQVISNLNTITSLLNDAFSDKLASWGFGRIVLLENAKLLMNIDGRLKSEMPDHASLSIADGLALHNHFIIVDLDEFKSSEAASEALSNALRYYLSEGDGAYVWVIPDGYMASLTDAEKEWEAQGGGYFSHESICVSNTADLDTRCQLEVLYEDLARNCATCEFNVSAHRSVHYRLDKLKDPNGEPLIAKDAPVSYKLISLDTRVVVQGSRILTSGKESEFASFGTVMAWCPQQRR